MRTRAPVKYLKVFEFYYRISIARKIGVPRDLVLKTLQLPLRYFTITMRPSRARVCASAYVCAYNDRRKFADYARVFIQSLSGKNKYAQTRVRRARICTYSVGICKALLTYNTPAVDQANPFQHDSLPRPDQNKSAFIPS